MKINTISYYFKDAFTSLKRNKTISIASMITVLITFFVLGIFMLVANNINKGIDTVQNKVELKIFLKDDIKLIDQREIEIKLRDIDGVKDVVYQSKEDEYKNFKNTTNGNDGLLQGYTLQNNPFSASFTVKLNSPEYASSITEQIKDLQGIEKIGDQQDIVDKVVSIVKGIKFVGFGLFVILIGVSIFLIMNTTKLTVYSRRREVGIMKFVGATDWFIRWPFVIEGMVIGLVGSILSCILLFVTYKWLFSWIASHMVFVTLVSTSYVLTTLLWQFIIGGVIVGGVASVIALRKFLDV
ncbi:permease-like cell division protein FtsX [Clostridium saccharobutylicum]|uniref:Cell division protein FtsX n=1 Tax=Clostridium saccharobutylicum DSM 13864 TaxID=1345695 RepID=U5MXJ1_CLOSA|nr:permease-like cell division protein FtsX [Clostridium saccharobutylicum]AGX45268.1 cell division protein FtsX [Clostridium saccharobutylicum DSM 13864]MBC2403155.1 ABC transporter permease [Clostridium saccharobutylicum]MBC2414051.1 ABC transporter permease [Clostridium saccharobutylicum]MBC2435746.1 ABC transporter permease [Clostridium saccharobutylicum]MBC2441486.1 ABC transporter permease [Clostridium saccharobutylicum]